MGIRWRFPTGQGIAAQDDGKLLDIPSSRAKFGFMKSSHLLLTLILLASPSMAQVVVPASPKKFVTRPIGDDSTGGVEVIPKEGNEAKKVRYTTHIVLSTERIWTSTEGKLLEGKLIAFEDMVVEAPQGGAAPQNPTPPEAPTVTKDDKVRLLIKKKPVEVSIQRLSPGDQEFIEQTRKAYTPKKKPTP